MMGETISFSRWLIQRRQVTAFLLAVGGAIIGVKVAMWTAPKDPSVHWFFAGALVSLYVAIILTQVTKDPEEY